MFSKHLFLEMEEGGVTQSQTVRDMKYLEYQQRFRYTYYSTLEWTKKLPTMNRKIYEHFRGSLATPGTFSIDPKRGREPHVENPLIQGP